MEKQAWPYVAGILDGEGSLSIHKANSEGNNSYRLQIVIYGMSIKLMKWLLGNFGGTFYSRENNPSGWTKTYSRRIYKWNISGRKNKETFLLGVLPYLVIKDEQAKIALEFVRLGNSQVPETRKRLEERMKFLNQGGSSVTTNMSDGERMLKLSLPKIESDLVGDNERASVVTQKA